MKQKSLFSNKSKASPPLAQSLKPQGLEHYRGQKKLLEKNIIQDLLKARKLPSLLFWGPPGCGKTSLARIIINTLDFPSYEISATNYSSKELKKLGEECRAKFEQYGHRTIVFIDEVHRLNKAQQDVLLPYLEDGSFLFIGATTENPGFEINPALVSRLHVLVFEALCEKDLLAIYDFAKTSGKIHAEFQPDALEHLCREASGDARYFLNRLELLDSFFNRDDEKITLEKIQAAPGERILVYDKDRDMHYDLISALHKSIRASDLQASVYYLQRMLQGGEDRKFILRRLIRLASEDIGLSDPNALIQCTSALSAFELLGIPEGDLCIHQAVLYLAQAPKSNSVYLSEKRVKQCVLETGNLPVPLKIRNPANQVMSELNYGQSYEYDHDYPFHISGQECLPDEIQESEFYEPGNLGFEKEVQRRMEFFEKLRKERRKK